MKVTIVVAGVVVADVVVAGVTLGIIAISETIILVLLVLLGNGITATNHQDHCIATS